MFEFGQKKKGRRSGRQDSNEPRTITKTKDSKGPEKGDAAAEVSKKGRHSNRRTSNKPRGERKPKDSKNPGKGAAVAEVSKKGRQSGRRPSNKPRGERKTKTSKNPVKGAVVAEVSLAIQDEQPAQDITTVQPSPPQATPETTHQRIDYPYHPVTQLFPLLEGPAFESLKKDIQENGQLVPVWIHQGQIIDGRNRDRACRELGIPTVVQEWNGKGSLVGFVLSQNVHRRHLNESQRAMVAARAKPHFEDEARRRMRAGKAPDPTLNSEEGDKGEAAALAAVQMNVSRDSVYMAQKVLREGTPSLQHAVESGQVSVSAAADLANLPKKEQKEAVAGGEEALAAKVKEVRQQKAGRKRNTKSGPGKGAKSVTAAPAAAKEEAPQANGDAINPVGPNPTCLEPPAQNEPTTQTGCEAPERTDAVGPEPPEPKLDREATSSIGPNSACPEPPAQDGPPTQSGGKSPERTDAAGPSPPEPKLDREVLNALRAAWEQAGSSERRVFLNLLLDDVESKTQIRAVMCPQYQG
jgi:hypothetical protein